MKDIVCGGCRYLVGESCRARPPIVNPGGASLAAVYPLVGAHWIACGAYKEDPIRLRERHATAENWDRHLDKSTKGVLA